ncbi:MAG: hypothetical protein K0S07_899 [Chlamydiales bacterium]|jgi:hypothetical protein|nr:hypothetical protein [Chlamydiales bacterium]
MFFSIRQTREKLWIAISSNGQELVAAARPLWLKRVWSWLGFSTTTSLSSLSRYVLEHPGRLQLSEVRALNEKIDRHNQKLNCITRLVLQVAKVPIPDNSPFEGREAALASRL